MNKVFEIATNISTPLMLAGFFAAAFFFIAQQIIKAKIFPQLTRQLSGEIIKIIIERLFLLALLAMMLGFVGYLVNQFTHEQTTTQKIIEHYERPSKDLIKISLQEVTAVDYLPKPETKNLTLKFKVISKSKDKFVPLKVKGNLITIDSTGKEKNYTFDVNFDDEGIKPQLISFVIMDGLIPRHDYERIKASKNYKAKCIFYYDNDIVPTNIEFITELFSLNKSIIRDYSE